MQQLTYVSPRRLEWHEVPEPRLDSDAAALVRPVAVSSCDFDGVAIATGVVPGPVPLGHEGAGYVVEVGSAVTGVAPGDLVIIPWKVSCGSCVPCTRGFTAQCSTVAFEACYSWGQGEAAYGGFLADVVLVPWADHMLKRVPAGLDPVTACGAADNITDGWRAVVPPLADRPGGSVLVAGTLPPGSIGLYAVAAAVAAGSPRVVYADVDAQRMAIAARYGAETIHLHSSPLEQLHERFDVTVDASGDPAVLHALLERTARAGHCTSTSALFYANGDVPFPTRKLYRNSISYSTGWVHTRTLLDRPDNPLELLADGRLDPAPVTSALVDWSTADEALNAPFVKVIATRG